MIIGIAGTLGAGKGTIADYLVKERGFKHLSVREYLIEEIRRRGLDINRDSMVLVANDLRAKFGPGYIIDELCKRALADGGDVVVESVRAVGEVEVLKGKGGILFGVDADIETRYRRVVERAGVTDRVSFDEFVADEQRELNLTDPTKGNLRSCVDMADHKFKNDWTIEELKGKVGAVLGKIGSGEGKYVRPSWDEYFMDICKTVAKRGTCDRGLAGCVIVKDKQILVTGYVGSPVGFPHCDDVGHKMEEWTHDGVKRMHCVRTAHAEQNAICQAAKLGIPIEGATLYCKMTPCDICAKMIVNAGIKRVVCEKIYHASGEMDFWNIAGIKLEVLDKTVEKYEGQ